MNLLFRALLALFFLATSVLAQSPQLIAPTDPLPPEEQRTRFHLPPGFEIQLVVSEDVIGQPMNLAFDAAGRLWVTSSVGYPYPAKGPGVQPRDARFGTPADHEPRDRVVVLEGIGADGKPAKVRTFAEGLNIPIGILPAGKGALVFDIPSIRAHVDFDGDGRGEHVTTLFTGYGNVDTHGMTNGFTRWIDGWVYACHGFRNTSKIRSERGGGTIELDSGNTYRFKADGSAIEQYTWGQVNPFGLTFDEWGHAYTGDCHSMPLTGLIRGAYYSSFGKPHDGLGFGPDMIDHNHGSTGICGPAYYRAEHFPPEYRGNLFLCNPVTGRIHRDELVDRGSTRFVKSLPDFVTCDDPWFRPVDCQLGPDGCLYVADFYNAIIGHYEVPLKHEKRDRTHGRVWRIVYRGKDGKVEPPPLPDLDGLSESELVDRLGDPNLVVRTLATNLLVDREPRDDPRRSLLASFRAGSRASAVKRAHALWALERTGGVDDALLTSLGTGDPSPLVRTHVAHVLAERESWNDRTREVTHLLLEVEENPFVQRAAADALGRHPSLDGAALLLKRLKTVPAEDTHLRHTIRVALRNHLRDDGIAGEYARFVPTDERTSNELASVALAVPTRAAAWYLVQWLGKNRLEPGAYSDYVRHVAQHGDAKLVDEAATFLQGLHRNDPARMHAALLDLRSGLSRAGRGPGSRLRSIAAERAVAFLRTGNDGRVTWASSGSVADPWAVERRRCADGSDADFLSTLPRGERVTGKRISSAFDLPAKLSFYVAGHCGHPDNPCHGRNVVRLRDAATGLVLVETNAPRNDTAQLVEWDLAEHAGKRGYVEIVDGDAEGAYAWIAVGRFSPKSLDVRSFEPLTAGVELVRSFGLRETKAELRQLLSDESLPTAQRIAAARALEALEPDARLRVLLDVAADPRSGEGLRTTVVGLFGERDDKRTWDTLAAATRLLPETRQRELADTLAGDRVGGEALLDLFEAGLLAPRLLADETLANRLVTAKVRSAESRIADLTKDLPSTDERIARAITSHRRSFAAHSPDAERGRLVFEKTCAACHRIGSKGSLIGPQLDGVGIRGLDRLLEDVLDPNRNVDGAFRTTTVVTTDGKVHVGLFRRAEGATLVFADAKGKEFTIPEADVDTRTKSRTSLMPSNLLDVLKPDEIEALLAYLLEQRRQPDRDH